jgi:hypothetical protein
VFGPKEQFAFAPTAAIELAPSAELRRKLMVEDPQRLYERGASQ